jgi:hypothetical protein
VVYDHIKVVKIAQQTTHEVRYAEDIFRGALHFEEVLNRLPSDLTKEQLHKEEDANIVLRIEQFKSTTSTR